MSTIYEIADSIAPFALSKEYCEKYGCRDNSGVQIDCGGETKGVLFALDLSLDAIARAKKIGANCIITHHPAIFNPLYSLEEAGSNKEVLAAAQAGISVLSSHLNLDTAKGGIDDCLMKGLGGKKADQVMHTLTGGSYGKVFAVTKCEFGKFSEHVSEEFHTAKIVSYGSGNVKKVASFCGAGMNEESVAFAIDSGVDTFVSSDGKHHLIKELVERGVKVVLLTHYAAEQYGFARYYEKFEKLLKEKGVRAELYTDERFL